MCVCVLPGKGKEVWAGFGLERVRGDHASALLEPYEVSLTHIPDGPHRQEQQQRKEATAKAYVYKAVNIYWSCTTNHSSVPLRDSHTPR